MIQVLDARFVTTAVASEGYPAGSIPEVAFVGRSNVGKSSMINVLAGRKKLVRVSNTPGRTRTLNFFELELGRGEARATVRLADLPGYGFAKVSKAEREQWEAMITGYLEKRVPLRAVVAIVDAEVGPTQDDVQTLDYLRRTGGAGPRRVLVAATKVDRLNKARRKPALSQAAQVLQIVREDVVGFSATERMGVEELWERVVEALGVLPGR